MEITKEQAMAYTEVLQVLKYMPKEEVNKIPAEVIQYYENNQDKDYIYKIDEEKTFEEQELLEETKVVLALFYRDYWATPEQREKIKQKEQYDVQQMELEKRKKYNTDDLFKKKQENKEMVTDLVEYKEMGWFQKFLQFMKRVFRKRQ